MSKKTKQGSIQQFGTLERFLTPLVERFSYKPDKDFARYSFGLFNEHEIFYYAINKEMCFTLDEFAKYIIIPYNTVARAFKRMTLKKFGDESYQFIEGKDYFKELRSNFGSMDNLSIDSKGDKNIIFLTFLGTWKLLPTFRNDIPIKLYHWFGEKLYLLMKSNQLISGEFFFTNKIGTLVHQIIGDKKRCFVDEKGYMYSSKGEMLIAKTLRQINIDFQYNAPINLPNWLITKLRKDFPKEILLKAGWMTIPSYITSDFLLRIIPKTVIEYWGIEDSSSYNAKREIKEFIYREIEIRCIPIEAHEDHNIPILKKNLLKKLEN